MIHPFKKNSRWLDDTKDIKTMTTPSKPKECIHYKLDLAGKCLECKELMLIKPPPSSPLEERILERFDKRIEDLRVAVAKSPSRAMSAIMPALEEDHKVTRKFISEVIAEVRAEERDLVCEYHKKHPCYKCLDIKYGKWRSPVDKDDPAWTHSKL